MFIEMRKEVDAVSWKTGYNEGVVGREGRESAPTKKAGARNER
jgi:hypothetical protein